MSTTLPARDMTALLFDLAPLPEHRQICIDKSLYKRSEQVELCNRIREEYPDHRCHEYGTHVDIAVEFPAATIRVRFLIAFVGIKATRTIDTYVMSAVSA